MVDDQKRKGERFQELHRGEPFIIPNPWDAGSAKVLEALGFKALATTSSGFAFTLGRADGASSFEDLTAHVRGLCQETALPVSVDLENGRGPEPEAAAQAIELAADAGAVGGSIEDWDPDQGIYPIEQAVTRVAAACQAARILEFPFMVTARAENHIRGHRDLNDTIARLTAYERAGADVVYAPGLRGVQEIQAICDAVTVPVNVLAYPGITSKEIFGAGAQRISVGGALTWTAIEAAARAAEQIRDQGDFSGLASAARIRDWLGSG
jgi:2-methylisocitrate lyase-like PEP mutase family enzyme